MKNTRVSESVLTDQGHFEHFVKTKHFVIIQIGHYEWEKIFAHISNTQEKYNPETRGSDIKWWKMEQVAIGLLVYSLSRIWIV